MYALYTVHRLPLTSSRNVAAQFRPVWHPVGKTEMGERTHTLRRQLPVSCLDLRQPCVALPSARGEPDVDPPTVEFGLVQAQRSL